MKTNRSRRDKYPTILLLLIEEYPGITVPRLNDLTGIPTRSIYFALGQLERLGLIKRISGRPQGWKLTVTNAE